MAIETEVLVVGAGPGGYVAAIKLGKLGKKTLLVDKDKLGGECLNYGCIPSKALIHSAGLYSKMQKAGSFGLETGNLKLHWNKVQDWKASMVAGFNRGIAALAKGNNVSIMNGTATLTGPHRAEIETGSGKESVSFQHALIVTGTRPAALPGFAFDGKNVLSSKEALELPEPPKRLVVIGGGVIGLEIGTFYAKLGAKVSVVEFMPQVLPGLEADLLTPVLRNLQKLGVEVLTQSKAKSYSASNGGLAVAVETPSGERKIEADKILVSVGRAPVTKELGLQAAGVETDAKGHITVNERYQSSASHIYAAGDVIGPPYLAHKASREGILAALDICRFSGEDRGPIPWAVFTDPEIAFVGQNEAEAKAAGHEILVGRFPFSASGRAQAVREPEGFVKVIARRDNHRILGVGMVGPNASDLIGEASLAVRLEATVEDVAATIHPHPTLNEAFQEAAEACIGQAIHILAPAARSA
ncbi:MAG: dihydrolipoyl dehydrogenase [Elusimicrobia bacterium]|nr:dihydrolipoyl dehydrogenase [Elusimicrobiota bacterium]